MYLKQIFNSIKKYRLSTSLTILSLLISFVGITVLTLYVSFEKSFDSFHHNSNSIYRFETIAYGSDVSVKFAEIIKNEVPEVEDITVIDFSSMKIQLPEHIGNNNAVNIEVIHTSQSFFKIFTFPIIVGNDTSTIVEPNTVALTKALAKKIFANENPIGQTVILSGDSYIVTALMSDFPKNSSFMAEAVASIETYYKNNSHGINKWSEWSYNIFIKLANGSNGNQVAQKIEDLPDISKTIEFFKSEYPNQTFCVLRPLSKIHYLQESNYESVNSVVLKVLSVLAIILAVMGLVNYINFSTSQAFYRIKSLSVIRVFGAKRGAATRQLIMESVFISLVVLLLTFLMHWLVYAKIESFFNISGLSFAGRYEFVIYFVLGAIIFGVLAAIYPARYIASSPLIPALKGKPHFTGKGKIVRSSLVTLQFVFAITLLISAAFIEKQLNYWQNFDIGIDKKHVVYLSTTKTLRNSYEAFANELIKNDNIIDYTYTQFIPGNVWMGWGRKVDEKFIQLKCWPVDTRFFNFFGIEIAQGHKFSETSDADINTFILNQNAVHEFAWEKPLEKQISGFDFMGDVIGVAKDFNFSNLKEPIQPMQFWLTDTRKNKLILRLAPGNTTQTIAYINSIAQQFDPANKAEVKFLDDSLNEQYNKEKEIARFVEFVALWCMLLSITGILGLVIFMSRDRIKEIGIRKVNGAKVTEIMQMLNRDFVKWVAIAFIIACPIAYFAMSKWLENFAYKTSLSWWVYALAGCTVLFIALLTVSWQTFKAARRNPVEALRYE